MYEALCFQREDGYIAARIKRDELVCDKVYVSHRASAWEGKDCVDSFLAKDVYLPGAELRIIGANCKEGLYGVKCDDGDLGINAKAIDLLSCQLRCLVQR